MGTDIHTDFQAVECRVGFPQTFRESGPGPVLNRQEEEVSCLARKGFYPYCALPSCPFWVPGTRDK